LRALGLSASDAGAVVSDVASENDARRRPLATTVTFKRSSDDAATRGTSNAGAMSDALA
jgi:hypothetical protein